MASGSGSDLPATTLEGQPNFRDLGGARTVGGSLVATGEVYRSGELSALTDADLSRLEDLGICTAVDLRSEPEVVLQPDRLPASVTYCPIPALPGGAGAAIEQFFRTFNPADFPPWEDV
jgi:protein tyrosine/serine phosphatase